MAEIKRKLMLSGHVINVPAEDFAALLAAVLQAANDKKAGFDHVFTDLPGWLRSLAPFGVSVDKSFVEDMLCSANLLNELERFHHPLSKTFDATVRTTVPITHEYDKFTNTIREKQR